MLTENLHQYQPVSQNIAPSTLLNHPRFMAWWKNLNKKYEIIIANAGACGENADTLSVLTASDQVLWLSRCGVSQLDAITLPDQLAEGYGIGPILHVFNTTNSEKGFKGRLRMLWRHIMRLRWALPMGMRKAKVQP